MTYRFRRILERPDWTPPVGLTMEVTYEAMPCEIPYGEDEPIGGVSSVSWSVVAIRGPLGQYHQPEVFPQATTLLKCEPDLDATLSQWALEDFAQRTK